MLKTFEINNKTYTFFCKSVNTRSGFAHICTLYYEQIEVISTKINYYNRTWENYTYQSVMKKAVTGVLDNIYNTLEMDYRLTNSIKRMTQAKRIAFESTLKENKRYTDYQTLLERL